MALALQAHRERLVPKVILVLLGLLVLVQQVLLALLELLVQ